MGGVWKQLRCVTGDRFAADREGPFPTEQEDRELPELCIQEGWRVGGRNRTYEAEKTITAKKKKEKKRKGNIRGLQETRGGTLP